MTICKAYKLILNDREAASVLGVTINELQTSQETGELLNAPAPQFLRFGSEAKYCLFDLHEWKDGLDVAGKEGL